MPVSARNPADVVLRVDETRGYDQDLVRMATSSTLEATFDEELALTRASGALGGCDNGEGDERTLPVGTVEHGEYFYWDDEIAVWRDHVGQNERQPAPAKRKFSARFSTTVSGLSRQVSRRISDVSLYI